MASSANEVGRIDMHSEAGQSGSFTILCETTPGGDSYTLRNFLDGRQTYEGHYSAINDVRNVWQNVMKGMCEHLGYQVLRVSGLAQQIERKPPTTPLAQLPNPRHELAAAPILF